jgi:hypothetical protein
VILVPEHLIKAFISVQEKIEKATESVEPQEIIPVTKEEMEAFESILFIPSQTKEKKDVAELY